MQIEFYAEFPKQSINKLKLIKFPTRVFIATHSIKEFQKFEKQAKKINKRITCAYWPLVKNSYWISPFSNTKDLIELFSDLQKIKNHLLIDLEPPLLKKRLFLKNIFAFRKNKKIIKKFLEKNTNRITTAQHPIPDYKIMKILGLDYPIQTEKSLMYYTSMIPKLLKKKIQKRLINIKDKQNYSIGLGTTAIGILSNEPIFSHQNLKKDLNFIKKGGFKKVIIFRLGGLNKEYIKVINQFK